MSKISDILEGLHKNTITLRDAYGAPEIPKDELNKAIKAEEKHVKNLKAELKKHPNDTHTEYIKERLKKAEECLKNLKAGMI